MPEFETALFQIFCDTSPLGICLIDRRGRIIHWNKASETITGYFGAEVLGKHYRDDTLVGQAQQGSAPQAVSLVADVLSDGKETVSDLFLRHKLGHLVPVHIYVFPLRNSEGEMKGVAALVEPEVAKTGDSEWSHRTDREFEIASGLPAVEDTREKLQRHLESPLASSTAILLIEMSEQGALLKHGGSLMLHQAIRVLAKTVTGLLPPRAYLGSWNDWRLVGIIPNSDPTKLEKLRSTLAGIGSTCQVKWWGDRIAIQLRTATRTADQAKSVESLVGELEKDLKSTANGKE